MQRINTPDGQFHAGDPSTGTLGTMVTRDFMQSVQEELAAIPEGVGMALDPNDNKQVVKAIQKMIDAVKSLFAPIKSPVFVGDPVKAPGMQAAGKVFGVNSPNLLFNGSGEFGSAGWFSGNSSGIDTNGLVLKPAPGSYGEGTFWALDRDLDGKVGYFVDYSDFVGLADGITISLQAELYAAGLTGGAFYIDAEFYDDASPPKILGQSQQLKAIPGTGWTYLTASSAVPRGTRKLRIRKVLDGNPKGTRGQIACRRIKLEWGTSASLYSSEADLPRVALLDSPKLTGTPTAPTPATDDKSTRLATTEWVASAIAIATATIGQIVFEPRTAVRAGYVKCNGAELNRADYPALWAYAQASGALVEESDWSKGNWGCFSKGDGKATFRIPELRGEFIRCWADGRDDIDPKRGIGTFQDSANRSHAHGASASWGGDHVHSAWVDAQGNHSHTVGRGALITPASGTISGSNGAEISNVGGGSPFPTSTNGQHSHNVGVSSAGGHNHTITINADGSSEARPRNVAMLAMIRAY